MSRLRRIAGALGALLFASHAAAQAPGQVSAWITPPCDHACLTGFLDRYMDALAHRDPGRVPLAKGAMFTENDVTMPIGKGLWRTISGVSDKTLELADTQGQEGVWLGLVYEHGKPAYFGLRLKVEDGGGDQPVARGHLGSPHRPAAGGAHGLCMK